MKETDNTITTQIQSLVDGGLNFDERSQLLREIDIERPNGWRDVALAFVEREILAEATQVEAPSGKPVVAFWVAAAACLTLAGFALGWVLHPEAVTSPGIAQNAPAAVASKETNLPLPSPDILRSANEKLAPTGYGASMVTRYVRAELADGKQLVIPVSQVMLGYRGD